MAHVAEGFPPKSTVHGYFVDWMCTGVLDRIHHALYVEARETAGREASPSCAIIDAQSVKAAEKTGMLDCPIGIHRKKDAPLSLRLIAFRLPAIKAKEARGRARRAAKREGYAVSGGTLAAAGWIILVTSLDAEAFPAAQTGELYRTRHAGRMLSA